MPAKSKDQSFMEQALVLARKAKVGSVSPNPRVGAVIVRAGKVIGQGFHARFGGPHAEVAAIASVKDPKKLRNATLYVTLEPCSTTGKTPPCTQAIINSGISRVVAALADPNEKHRGRGFKVLEKAGVRTECGLCQKEARELNPAFFKLHSKGLPFITLKLAISLDGKIATRTGDSKWISAPESRKVVARLRKEVDAVMVGSQTVRRDDPVLLPDTWEDSRQIYRIAVDPRLSIPETAKIFKNGHGAKTLLIANAGLRVAAKKKQRLENRGITILPVLETQKRGQSALLAPAMRALAGMGISHVLCEGGGTLAAALIEERLIDRVVFFVAPKIIGGACAPTAVDGAGAELLGQAVEIADMKLRHSGPDILVEGALRYPPAL